MATWDVFHSDRLEVERGLDDAAVRRAFDRGDLTDIDLIRAAGSSDPWEPLADRIDGLATASTPRAEPEPEPEPDDAEGLEILDDADFEFAASESSMPSLETFGELVDDEDESETPRSPVGAILPPMDSAVAIPVPGPAPLPWDEAEFAADFDGESDYDPLDEDEAVAEFTLARGSAQTVEELDLAAMVDVAFQLVLFFLVTATTILYKSLEVPKPNNDAPPEAAAQGRTKSLDDLKADFILVEIDALGVLKLDRQSVPGDLTMLGLADRLRALRADTGRTAMLLSADFATPHRNAVLAYDAANEIGLRIAIAKPKGPAVGTPPPVAKRG